MGAPWKGFGLENLGRDHSFDATKDQPRSPSTTSIDEAIFVSKFRRTDLDSDY